ncbi:MAG: hypothetical protein ACOCW6_00450, partial [Spirochaetota bacterium]
MAGHRFQSRYLLLFVISVVLICSAVAVLGFTRLRRGIEELSRADARNTLTLVEEVVESTGGNPAPGTTWPTDGGSVRVLSLSEVRSEFGFVGNLAFPIEFSTVGRTEAGRQLVVARSLGDTPLVLVAEVSLASDDR